MGIKEWLGLGSRDEPVGGGADVRVGRPEEHAGTDPRAGEPQEERVRVGTPEEAGAEDTYHGPVDAEAEDRHEEERARHSGI